MTATAGDAQVALSWPAVTGATSYTVKRALTGSGSYATLAPLTATTHTDTTAINGTTYDYVVTAVNNLGESASAQSTATPLTPYESWKAGYGLSALADTATPDGDGIPILIKYATGMTPGTSGPSPITLATVNDTLTRSFNRLTPAPVTYAVEASADLTTWTTIAALAAGDTTWSGNVIETGTGSQRAVAVTDTLPLSANPRRFLRLRVTR